MDKIFIIHQDQDFIIINKPSGLVCNRAESVKTITLQDWMEDNNYINIQSTNIEFDKKNNDYDLRKEFISKSGLVHRLDKETSGVMVIAKTLKGYIKIKSQFLNRKIKKRYLALVHGIVQPNYGSVNLPLKRNILNRHKFCVQVDGKMSKTIYNVQRYYKFRDQNFSLIELDLLTGRTHQIRVHMSHLGYPLVSDPLYLGKRFKSDIRWCPRLFLHAQYLSFNHPITNKRMEYTAELTHDLINVLQIF